MSHKSGHIIIDFADDLMGLEDRLDHLSEEQQEKILEIVKRAHKELREVAPNK